MPGFPSFINSASSSDRFDYDGLPPELAGEAQAINRKQQMANYLLQQGMQPAQGQMVGGWYVPASPVQGLAGLLQAGVGMYGNMKADEARKGVGDKSKAMLAEAMQKYKEASDPVTREGPRPTAQVMPPPQNLGPHAGLMPQPDPAPSNIELSGPGAPVQVARPPEDKRQAMVDLMLNSHPQAQRVGNVLLGELDKSQAREDQQTFMGEQRGLDRTARTDDMKMNLASMVANRLITQDQANNLLAQNQKLHDERMTADKERDRQNAVKLKGMDVAGKKDVAGMKAGSNRPMSATAQKELIQTEEEMQGAHAGMKSLDQALALNDQAMGFSGAGMLAGAGSLLPESVRPKAIDATVELDNILTSGALPQLKAIFGGMPTEGERKVLLDVQGSSGKTPAVRKEIFGRAKEALQNRLKFNAQKAEQLRGGTYFTGDGGLDTTVTPPGQAPATSAPAAASGVPPGAKQIGTSKGKPVYQLPDGSNVIAE